LRIAVVVGTSARPVASAADTNAPGVTFTPNRSSAFDAFPNDKPST
jgi:hypothetical protein